MASLHEVVKALGSWDASMGDPDEVARRLVDVRAVVDLLLWELELAGRPGVGTHPDAQVVST